VLASSKRDYLADFFTKWYFWASIPFPISNQD